MTTLKEDDFLEKLMPYLQRGSEAEGDGCPDSESLVAFGEGTLDASRTERIRHHVARCTDCGKIHERLLRFDSDVQPAQSEWLNAEKRLDIWINSLLRKETTPSQEIRRAGLWHKLWRMTASSRVRYGMAGAMIALVVGASVTITTSRRSFRPSTAAPVPAVGSATTGAGPVPPVPKAEQQLEATGEDQSVIGPRSAVLEAAASDQKTREAVYPMPPPQSTVRIEPGTEVLIRIASTKKQPDGRFSFQGLLLKPLPDSRGKELLPVGSLVAGSGVSSSKELTIQTLELPIGVQLQASKSISEQYSGLQLQQSQAAPPRFSLQGSRANATVSSPDDRTLSNGKTVQLKFVLSSKYQITPSH
jgi:hypothetical protein